MAIRDAFEDVLAGARRVLGLDADDGDKAALKSEDGIDEKAFVDLARDEYKADLDADAVDREAAQNDNDFANADDENKQQWDQAMKDQRIGAGRPVLQTNLMPSFIQQIVNEGRSNSPAIKITPADGGSEEVAEYLQARIRHIEYESDASTVWDTARDQQVTSSRGWVRMMTAYLPGSFKLKPGMDRIPNQFSVVWDRAANKYDLSDAERVFVISRISQVEHTRRFGKKTTLASLPFATLADDYSDWVGLNGDGTKGGELVQIAELFKKHYRQRKLLKLANGTEAWEDELAERKLVPQQIIDERVENHLDCIRHFIINGVEILRPIGQKKRYLEWLTDQMPIVPVWGREAVVKGRKRRFSLIGPAKDDQRSINFLKSNMAEQVGQMPKVPWIIEFGSIPPTHEDKWAKINTEPQGFVYWIGSDPLTGQTFKQPFRESTEPPLQGLTIALHHAIDSMKASMGIFDAARGARSNETSGVAIEQRKMQSSIVNLHFPGNENRSRKRVGEILVSMIRVLDKNGGEYPVRDEDGTTRTVAVGTPFQDPKTGKDVTLDLATGHYSVVCETGIKWESAKAEENARIAEFIKADPELMRVIGDQLIRTSDMPGAEEMADRVAAWIQNINPGVIKPKEGEEQPIPPAVQQAIQERDRKIAELEGFAQEQTQKIETDETKETAQTEREDRRIAFEQWKVEQELAWKREELAAKSNIELTKLGMQEALGELKAQIDVLNKQAGIADAVQARETAGTQAEAARDHESAEAQQAREHEAAQADANRTAASDSQAADQDLQREMAASATEGE